MSPVMRELPKPWMSEEHFPHRERQALPGKYIDMYVGCIEIWILSKWFHIVGVGFVSRPAAKCLLPEDS